MFNEQTKRSTIDNLSRLEPKKDIPVGINRLRLPDSGNDRREPLTLADRIERINRALTASELAEILNVSRITIFKQAKAGRIPSFRIGTCVRFDPRAVAQWLRRN
jgi:excisionase family DNA binding protein